MKQFDRITTNPARMNGAPCIRNLRLTVKRVLDAVATYPDRAELKREYPELEDEDIRQALEFAGACLDDKIVPLAGAVGSDIFRPLPILGGRGLRVFFEKPLGQRDRLLL